MKKFLLQLGGLSLFLSGMILVSCSSGEDSEPSNGNPPTSTTTKPSGTVPQNTDSGKNNNSEPDNIKPNNPGNDNNGTGNDNNGSGNDNTGGDSENNTSTWKLVFEDNFEGTDSIPNTEYWTLAPKGTDTWNRHMSESYGQAYQKDGYLYLFGMESDSEYLTGGIESRGKFDFTYGQVKVRARFLRQPQGNHTGIWMMPEPPADKWPMSGEIDIMEHLNDESIVYETVHNWWADELGHKDDPIPQSTARIDNDEFNTYGIIWDESSISFTVNGEVNFTYNKKELQGDDAFYQWPYSKPFYLILSQSLGGKDTWEGVIDNSELPAVFQIDWVKVWQKTE